MSKVPKCIAHTPRGLNVRPFQFVVNSFELCSSKFVHRPSSFTPSHPVPVRVQLPLGLLQGFLSLSFYVL